MFGIYQHYKTNFTNLLCEFFIMLQDQHFICVTLNELYNKFSNSFNVHKWILDLPTADVNTSAL